MKQTRRILVSALAALLVTLLVAAGALTRVDKWVQDWLFQRPGVTASDIVIIGIDDEAFSMLGPYNTWDRNVIAYALDMLSADPEKRPAVTAVDILYAGETDPEADAHLARAAEKLGNVITASMATFGEAITWADGRAASVQADAVVGYETPFPALRDATVQGHINAVTDRDGVMRHALIYIDADGQRVDSMAVQAAKLYLEGRGETLELPDEKYLYVPFTGRPGDYWDGVSIAHVLSGDVPADYWAGKIVLIGPYAAALQDAYFTPIDKGRQMYGVEFQANVIQSLLEGRYKHEAAPLPQLILLFMLSAILTLLFMRMGVSDGAVLCGGVMLVGGVATALLYGLGWVTHPLWLPACALVLYLLSMVGHYVVTAREKRALALEKERIGAELALATRIQANSLPKEFPPFPERGEFDIYASMTPAKEVGGDLYDFYMIDDDHLCLVIGDVSGKGVPASLFMMLTTALIHHVAMGETSPAKVLEIVNREICARNPEEMFVTVWLGVLEISTGILTAANAGHEYPAVKRAGEPFELFKDKHGFVVGGMEGIRYREYTLRLDPGDALFVYTDGVPEATNAEEQLFGTGRMIDALRAAGEVSPEQTLEAVSRAVAKFVGSAPQFDDLTMLCLKYKGVGRDSTQ